MIFILAILATLFCVVLNQSPSKSNIDPKTEETFLENIRNFLRQEGDVLRKLKEFKKQLEIIHVKATQDENYLKKSINEFLIIKRLVMDWHFIKALASFNKHTFLNELQKNVSIIQQHPEFPSFSNLKDTVLKIANAQDKRGIQSVGEFVVALTSDPYTKLTASECSVFAEVLKGANKDTLAKSWEVESRTLEALFDDPLMEIRTITK